MPESSDPTGLQPLFNHLPKDIAAHEVFAAFPKNTFLENLSCDESGNIFVTSHEEGAVYKIDPQGQQELYAKTSGKLTGIIQLEPRSFLLNGWDNEGIPTIFLLDPHRTIQPLTHPEGALFLNGMTLLDNNTVLICDAYKGCIWRYDLNANTAEIWLRHSLLTRVNEASPIPAANGIKIFNDAVFVSNTDKHLFISIPLKDAAPGTPEIFLDKVNIDDFAIDEEGAIYAATHIYNSVLRITSTKRITIIGEAEQGLTGSTAVAFGKTAADKNSIYVTTNGGMWLPPPEGVQAGKVIKLKVNP